MLRIAGVIVPGKKRIVIALTEIKGIGRSLSASILKELNIDEDVRPDDLKETDAARLRARIEQEEIEGDLTRKVSMDVLSIGPI